MDKSVKRIFILGFIWVVVGMVSFATEQDPKASTLLLAIGLVIESVAFLLFFWKKINQK